MAETQSKTADQAFTDEAFERELTRQGFAVSRFADLRRVSVDVRKVLEMGGTAETCCLVLYEQLRQAQARVIDLELIAPRKVRLPDGRVLIYRCPDELVPEAT